MVVFPVKNLPLNKSVYGLGQASRSWQAHLTSCLKMLLVGIKQCLGDACVFRLVREGRMAIIAIVHVDDIFAIGPKKSGYNRFRDESSHLVQVKNLGELCLFGGCHYLQDRQRGTLAISWQTFARELGRELRVISEQSVPFGVGVKLEEFEEEKVESWPFRKLVGSRVCLSISTRPDTLNAVRDVVRSCSTPKPVCWETTLGI